MGSYTDNLGLYKVNTETDGNDTFNIDTMMNDNWEKIDKKLEKLPVQNGGLYINSDTTEEDKAEAQNALFWLGYGVKSYLGFTNIGLENGSETIENIANKLPAWSELITPIGSSNNTTIYPTTYGSLRVIKYDDSNRVIFEFTKKGFNQKWFGVYDSSISAPWSGWVETANPAGYLPLDGSVPMSGMLDTTSVALNGKQGHVFSNINTISVKCKKSATDEINYRELQLLTQTYEPNNANMFRITESVDGIPKSYKIFGEHNKPIGMYTGNGSSAKREIPISGIGGTIIIRSSATTAGTIAIIHGGMGAFGKIGTSFTTLSSSEAKFPDNTGVLELTTASDLVNKNGVTYYYQVL